MCFSRCHSLFLPMGFFVLLLCFLVFRMIGFSADWLLIGFLRFLAFYGQLFRFFDLLVFSNDWLLIGFSTLVFRFRLCFSLRYRSIAAFLRFFFHVACANGFSPVAEFSLPLGRANQGKGPFRFSMVQSFPSNS